MTPPDPHPHEMDVLRACLLVAMAIYGRWVELDIQYDPRRPEAARCLTRVLPPSSWMAL